MIIDDPDKTPNVPATPMISVEAITYAEDQWDQIRTVFRDELGLDADQTERQITPVIRKSLRSCIELAVSQYYFQSAATSRRRHRAELSALRKDIENLRASIIDALAVPVGRKGGMIAKMLLPGVDADMLPSTNDYFRKLARNLDRQIAATDRSDTLMPQSVSERVRCRYRCHSSSRSRRAASLAGFFDLSHVLDGLLKA